MAMSCCDNNVSRTFETNKLWKAIFVVMLAELHVLEWLSIWDVITANGKSFLSICWKKILPRVFPECFLFSANRSRKKSQTFPGNDPRLPSKEISWMFNLETAGIIEKLEQTRLNKLGTNRAERGIQRSFRIFWRWQTHKDVKNAENLGIMRKVKHFCHFASVFGTLVQIFSSDLGLFKFVAEHSPWDLIKCNWFTFPHKIPPKREADSQCTFINHETAAVLSNLHLKAVPSRYKIKTRRVNSFKRPANYELQRQRWPGIVRHSK